MSWIKSSNQPPADDACNHLSTLVSQLRLAQLPTSFLLDTVCTNALIRANTECRDYLDEAKHYQMSLAQLIPSISLTERMLPRHSYAGEYR